MPISAAKVGCAYRLDSGVEIKIVVQKSTASAKDFWLSISAYGVNSI